MHIKTLKISSLDKWCNRDDIILHAAFQSLVDYIEKDHAGVEINWGSSPEMKKVWKEINSLYTWWTKVRPYRKNPLDDKSIEFPPIEFEPIEEGSKFERKVPYDKKKYKKYTEAIKKGLKLEDQWYKEDQKNLHRLVDIRLYLWT
jgi:hypothetical protein